MRKYKLSARARAQLVDLYELSCAAFGAYPAEAYHAGLAHTFELIADFPRIGQRADDLAPYHRRFHFQAHVVFYTETMEYVLIRAIFHHGRDIRADLFA